MSVFSNAVNRRHVAFGCRISDPLTIWRPRRLILTAFGRGDLTYLTAEIYGEDVGVIVSIRVGFVIGEESDFISIWIKRDSVIVGIAGGKLSWLRFIDGGKPNMRATFV